ncbi:MAG: hypothetical protein ACE5FU_09830, partial [Nitrospinota bacterium]
DGFQTRDLYLETLERIEMAESYVKGLEQKFYNESKKITEAAGYIFLDNLSLLRKAGPKAELYNPKDLHINEVASEIIGGAQAKLLQAMFKSQTHN